MISEQQRLNNKQLFLSIAKDNISRKGIDELLEFLSESDFFVAPCSTKYHLSERGGLCLHSLNVYRCMIDLCHTFNVPMYDKLETITVISLFHDICKTNFYKLETRPVKEDGKWIEKKVYVVDDQFPIGHGEKSVIMLSKYLNLTNEEMLAIRWHMNAWDNAIKGGDFSINEAKAKSQFISLLQCADQIATDILEK